MEAIKEGIDIAGHTKRDKSLNTGFMVLSADEMKERGFLGIIPCFTHPFDCDLTFGKWGHIQKNKKRRKYQIHQTPMLSQRH